MRRCWPTGAWRLAMAVVLLLRAVSASPAPMDDAQQSCFLLTFKNRNMKALQAAIEEVSGPSGPRAGQWLSPSEVADLSGRSQGEVDAVATFVAEQGGSVLQASPTRDMALACFPTHANVLQAGPAQDAVSSSTTARGGATVASVSPVTASLMSATRKAATSSSLAALLWQPAGTAVDAAAISAAERLAAAVPASLARTLDAVLPLPGPGDSTTGQARTSSYTGAQLTTRAATSNDGSRGHGPYIRGTTSGPAGSNLLSAAALRRRGAVSLVTTRGSITGVNVPSPYAGVPLPVDVGSWTAVSDPSNPNAALAVPYFLPGNTLYPYGISNLTYLLNNINTWPVAFMLPCSLSLSPSDALQAASYAKASQGAACAGNTTVYWAEVYPSTSYHEGTTQSNQFVPQPLGTCGEAVARSKGMLPPNTCALIKASIEAQMNVTTDIADDTLLYGFDMSQSGPPSFTGLDILVTLQLADSVPAPWNAFGALISFGRVNFAGKNRPQELRALYNVPPAGGSVASTATAAAAPSRTYNGGKPKKGTRTQALLAAPALYFPSTYYVYSPADLATANKAFALPVPVVESVINPPDMPPNDPVLTYSPEGGSQGEAALDIQVLTQFGAGSGARYGFVAASNSTSAPLPGIVAAYLGLIPLPNVLTLSWVRPAFPASAGGNVSMYSATEAVFAKLAAMGTTTIASSGDSGMLAARNDNCSGPVVPNYPAVSTWVTAVGALQQARATPGGPFQLVTAMTALGADMTSGGGFGLTDVATTPTWQAAHVRRYIDSQLGLSSWPLSPANTPTNYAGGSVSCNASNSSSSGAINGCVYGRGIPDVALIGADVPIMDQGLAMPVSGTSVSAPTFAGLVMHLNAAVRSMPGLERCKLGFLNPFLYWAADHYPNAFTDITVGGNGFEKSGTPCNTSYNAAVGWDAATGLGMPNVEVLQQAAMEYVCCQQLQQSKLHRKGAKHSGCKAVLKRGVSQCAKRA